MNEERPISLTKWYGLLVFASGSLLTAIVAVFDQGRGPMSGFSPALGLILLGWLIFGIVTGAWILVAPGWKPIDRGHRRRLALAYFAVGWGGLFGMSAFTPAISAVLIGALIAAAIVVLARELEGRQRKQDKGDIFP